MKIICNKSEQGFVLPTAIITLSLMALMSVGMYISGRTAIQVGNSAQQSTEGHYFAETAVNYMVWALRNDAEFDSYKYDGTNKLFGEPLSPTNAASIGDWYELMDNLSNPGPTAANSDSSGGGIVGQLMYFDNRPLADRSLVWPLPVIGGSIQYPTLYHISTTLSRYIRLDIDSTGSVTPVIPTLPHPATPVVGTDIPDNGAVVWMTTGNVAMDFEVDSGLTACSGTSAPAGAVACDADTGNWLTPTGTTAAGDLHGVVVYAIGYVGGRPSSIIRAQIK